jgi:hypothetical protein
MDIITLVSKKFQKRRSRKMMFTLTGAIALNGMVSATGMIVTIEYEYQTFDQFGMDCLILN